MTQGIQHSTRTHEFSPAYLARITPKVRPVARKRPDGWFVAALNQLFRVLIGRRGEHVPDTLIGDVGFGRHATAAELRSEFNRLDAQLHARIY